MKKALILVLSLLLILSPSITKAISRGETAVAGLSILAVIGGGYCYYTWSESDQTKKTDNDLHKELNTGTQNNNTQTVESLQQQLKQQQEQDIFNTKHQDTKTTTLDQQEQQPKTEPKLSAADELLKALDEHRKVNSQQTEEILQQVEKIEKIIVKELTLQEAKRQKQCETLSKALQNSFDHNY